MLSRLHILQEFEFEFFRQTYVNLQIIRREVIKKKVVILMHLAQWNIIFFAWIRWHLVRMRLNTTAL